MEVILHPQFIAECNNGQNHQLVYIASVIVKIKAAPIFITAVTKATKKRSERRKHCALAVVRRSQKFHPAAAPPP